MERKVAVQTSWRGTRAGDLKATWEEFEEVGFAKLSMEGVAKRAGTSKPVIYRRWPTGQS